MATNHAPTVPQPKSHNPQTQRLTATLRKVCHDYPAGAGVLRELLQNADDAGASVIEFVLDSRQHPKAPLLLNDIPDSKTFALCDFQGPALLSYNDAKFSNTDWKSLSSIGDSQKAQEKLSTGKFGLGFNSVYNWTDSPSIVSGSTILLLDPHHSWSKAFNPPGGPAYCFTDFPENEAMRNQLSGFSKINTNWRKGFEGTIIRLPLRTDLHASKSEIRSSEATTKSDIRKSLNNFVEDMQDSGLLFLKSVRRIRIAIDDEPETVIEMTSPTDLSGVRKHLRTIIEQNGQFQDKDGVAIYQEVEIRHTTATKTTSKRYGICHLFESADIDNNLSEWANSQKLLPWVAVAARLDSPGAAKSDGKLFTVLPLPIETELSVHLHGMFSISTDRAKLQGLDNSGAQDNRPERWNKFLFERMIPQAWIKLFLEMSKAHPEQRFQFWDPSHQTNKSYWSTMNEHLVGLACRGDLFLWPSSLCYSSASMALFAPETTNVSLVQAMQDLNVPLTLLPPHILELVEKTTTNCILEPNTLNEVLQSRGPLPIVSEKSCSVLMEYMFKAIGLSCLYQLPIFPYRDHSRRAVLPGKSFISRNSTESALFLEHDKDTLDDNERRLSPDILTLIHEEIGKPGNDYSVQYWSWENLQHLVTEKLAHCIHVEDTKSVSMILSYLSENHKINDYRNVVIGFDFILSTDQSFIGLSRAVQHGAENLRPYLLNVDVGFNYNHKQFLVAFGINNKPSVVQLEKILTSLDQSPLSDSDLDISIEIARIWAKENYPINQLKLPDSNKRLTAVVDLVYCDDPTTTTATRPFVHTKISQHLANYFGIEPLSQLVQKGELGILDEEDEFDQSQDTVDGIRDSLERYSIESTFPEYLANADDCLCASEVNLLFDGKTYPAEKLIDPRLTDCQGPALLIHNDGVFSDQDFEGFKHVGRGSKRDNRDAIGKFGRGSQTMYHWTNTPMILSGGYLIVLDPLKKCLPFNFRTKQNKPGVQMTISRVKQKAPDQLAPFEGLWGFDSNSQTYKGTIFRFPLRGLVASSDLLESLVAPDPTMVQQLCNNYFDEARISLLFLRNIQRVDYSTSLSGSNPPLTELQWSVSRGQWPDEHSFSDWAEIKVHHLSMKDYKASYSEKYLRVMKDVSDEPSELLHRHKRKMKFVECGIAALVGEKSMELKKLETRFFNCMPLKFRSHLPVHIHATFLLSGDRQNVVIEKSAIDAGSEWNRWLLETALPKFYFEFLEDLGRKLGKDVYEYFPIIPRNLTKDSCDLTSLIVEKFWENLPLTDRCIFPAIEPSTVETNLAVTPNRKSRKAAVIWDPRRAVFDFLDKSNSEALESFLLICQQPLVRPPPALKNALKRKDQLKSVTPRLVRDLIRSHRSTDHIQNVRKAKLEEFLQILRFIEPNEADMEQLHGCKILPLADGSLATLHMRKSSSGQMGNYKTFFAAPPEVFRLFEFARERFVDCKEEALVEKLLRSGLFNVMSFEKNHAPSLLKLNTSWDLDEQRVEWIREIWKYLNNDSYSGHKTLDLALFQDCPLVIVKCNGSNERLITLNGFESGPCVVEPIKESHRLLLSSIPNLQMAVCDTIPASIYHAEKDLAKRPPLERLMRSVAKLAQEAQSSIMDFVRSNLSEEYLEMLGDIMKEALLSFEKLPEKCYSLPVCKSCDPQWSFIPPSCALSIEKSAYLVPWMNNYSSFTEDKRFLAKTRIFSPLDALSRYILPNLPSNITQWKSHYIRMIYAMSNDYLSYCTKKSRRFHISTLSLASYRLAADQNGNLRNPNEYFDHADPIFSRAFQNSGDRYLLMKEVQNFEPFWKNLGIRQRHNGKIRDSDYAVCLEQLQSLISTATQNADFQDDLRTILQPLCSETICLEDTTLKPCTAIAPLAMFPVQKLAGPSPSFRHERTRALALSQDYLSMNKVVKTDFQPICWSQTPFTWLEPSKAALGKYVGRDKPPNHMVWDHLVYLSQIASDVPEYEIAAFLSDLEKTYEYLQSHATADFLATNESNAAIWLNAESMTREKIDKEELRTCWTSIDKLILFSPCDALPFRAVRPWLAKFVTLLEAAGCKHIAYPTPQLEATGESVSDLPLIHRFLSYQQKGALTDVTIKADGQQIVAHKLVLAASSKLCEAKFHGPGAEIDLDGHILQEMTVPFETVKVLVDFCYKNHEEWLKGTLVDGNDSIDEIADKLDKLLGVLRGCDVWLMDDFHQCIEHQLIRSGKYFVRPDNVLRVQEIAEETNAAELRKYCEEFYSMNKITVDLADLETEADDELA